MIEGNAEFVCTFGHEECALTRRGDCTMPAVTAADLGDGSHFMSLLHVSLREEASDE